MLTLPHSVLPLALLLSGGARLGAAAAAASRTPVLAEAYGR